MSAPEPSTRRVLVYSCGPYAQQLAAACEKAHIEIDGVHDPRSLSGLGARLRSRLGRPNLKSTLTREEFIARARTSGAPILVMDTTAADQDRFIAARQRLREEWQLENRILHPSFLCDYHRRPSPHYLITGFPGSGNMAFQNVLDRIVRHPAFLPMAQSERDPLDHVLAQHALWYWYSLSGTILSRYGSERESDVSGPTHMRYGTLNVRVKGQTIVFCGLPQRSYAWANPWSSNHEPVTRSMLDFFEAQSFTVIYILRHPLDVLVSDAAKMTVSSGRRAPTVMLANPEWLAGALERMVGYLRGVVENRARLYLPRYEDLLRDPAGTVSDMSSALGRRIGAADCQAIWKEIDGRDLSHSNHRWDPREGKWLEFVPRSAAGQIEQSGLVELAAELGYPIDLTRLEERTPDPEGIDFQFLAGTDHRWYAPTGKRPAYMHPSVRSERVSGVRLICASHQFERAHELLSSPLMLDLLAASRLDTWGEPSEIAGWFETS